MDTRRLVFLVFPDFQILDLTGPHEVFAQARRIATSSYGHGIEIDTVAASGGQVRSSHGLSVGPVRDLDDHTAIDTLIVVGGPGRVAACEDERLIGWLADAARRARRVASVCSGAFLLARAGLLDGRRAVTHWSACDELARLYPDVVVDHDPVFIRDGDVWTSAGVTAGIDLALALVEDDYGPDVSRTIARQLVMFVQRPGGQAQFSAALTAQRPARAPLRELQAWMAEHPDADLGVPALAARAGMSERHFTRVFLAETGRTPGAHVEAVRLEAAKRLLETTDTPVAAVARACGFGTAETMHRCFKRVLDVTPGQYRHHFTPLARAL